MRTKDANIKKMESVPFFQALSSHDQDTFKNSAIFKNYPKNSPIYHQGDHAAQFSIVLSGWVKLFNVTIDGKEIVAQLLTQGDFLDEGALFGNQVHFFSAIAVDKNVVIAELPASVMRKIAMEHPAVSWQAMKSMSKKIKNLQIENGNQATMDASQRLSCLLLRLSSWMTGKGGTFTLPYSKTLIAAQLGIEPATFSRLLNKMEEQGVTTKGSEIHIQDFTTLSEHSCSHCPLSKKQCEGRRIPNNFQDKE